MSRWAEQGGRFTGKGAAKRLRAAKRHEAELRDDCTPWERTAAHRRHLAFEASERIKANVDVGNLIT